MRLRLKNHYIVIQTTETDYLVKCSCGYFSSEQVSYDEILKLCLTHSSYSVSDYIKDKEWSSTQKSFNQQTKEAIRDKTLTIEEVEEKIDIIQVERERYETLELLIPVIERELLENMIF